MGKAAGARVRAGLRQLGNHLWAVIDAATLQPCRERVDGNAATSDVSTWVVEALAGLKEDARPRGFIGIAGESQFRATVFPDSVASHLSAEVRRVVASLARPNAGVVSLTGPEYRILLNVDPDAASVRAWIEEQLNVAPEQPKRREVRPTDDYVAGYAQLRQRFHDIRAEVAAELQPLLQRQAELMPSGDYADKQRLTSWINSQLRELGLALRCPQTGRPAILVADLKGDSAGASRFRFQVRNEAGRQQKTISSVALPALEVIPDEARLEGRARGPASGGTPDF